MLRQQQKLVEEKLLPFLSPTFLPPELKKKLTSSTSPLCLFWKETAVIKWQKKRKRKKLSPNAEPKAVCGYTRMTSPMLSNIALSTTICPNISTSLLIVIFGRMLSNLTPAMKKTST